ncbi:MAG TPA: DUF2779 domain-containing protein [Candidatus Krumholzibacteria bacterium]|nr:DUF2779 domain-containing protein [Candidatus Krumholzibacteria bacterium]HPD72974.1 DUF2779 domain-containing protein [Candidatus Krumholzibacteria bacterium]HRY41773.1 DUF2779 domain-containing protein [Candidatus Krumholzibacteria bacterium]
MAKTVISKSEYLAGLQCPKLLWTHYNDREAVPEPDAAKQAIFDTGHAVGDLAKALYPHGVEVPWSKDLQSTVDATRELMRERNPIFEASYLWDGCYCRVDVLVPSSEGSWDLYEVKSTTAVKDEHIEDVAFQAYILEGSGVQLDRLFLMHIDNTYVRYGGIDPEGLFHAEDITTRVREFQSAVPARVRTMVEAISGDRPATPIGLHCSQPYDCDLWKSCSSFLPDQNVLRLYRIRKAKAFKLIENGVLSLADVPEGDLNDTQLVQQVAVRSGLPQISVAAIQDWLSGLVYPLYCLDFETMNPAIPVFDGTRPFQQVPFQFSLHVIAGRGAEPVHHELLADKAEDPRRTLVSALKVIGPDGQIVAFNAVFEKGVLRDLAAFLPDEADFLLGLEARFVDLLVPFSKFWYYHPEQRGSCSLKDVLPAIVGKTYADLAIGDGGAAMREYQRAVFGGVDVSVKSKVLEDLRVYCRQDTEALVDVLGALEAMV